MDPALWETIEGGAATEVVAVLVRLRADAAPPRGLEIVARFGDVATARIARSAIIAVHDDPVVVSLKAARELRPEPAVAGAGAAARRRLGRAARRGLAAGPSGRGVVVGVIDWGVDFTHPNFVRDDGRTRLLALWDQRRRRAGGLPPYGYGRAWSRRQLDAALGARDPFATLGYDPADADVDGNGTHGTHVLDIAAGAPRIGPGGVAPGAELVFVHLASEPTGPRSIGNSVSLLEGLDFIARVAGDRPCVVNFSLGSHAGPHDGSTLVEQALDAFVTARPGRAIVQSAGNYRRAPVHATGALARGDRAVLEWVVSAGDETTNELDLWYPGRDRLEVRLRADDGRVVARATPDSHGPVVDDGDVIGRFAHRTLDPNNGDNHVALVLEPRGSAARWRVEVEPLRVAATGDRWHAWIERDEAGRGSQSRLRAPDASPASTTGTIANGHFTIVVGAVDATTGRVAPFSSAGPTRDGRIKPDLLAPGVGIVAARSTPADDAVAAPLLTRKSGTSMAAPYVTGAVAVIYEAAGRPLTIAAVRDLLGIRAGRAAAAIDLAAAVRAARAAPDGPAGVAPAALFDAFTAPARAAARFALPDVALVAAAGAAPTLDLRPGDWLIERALGEGDGAALTVLAADDLADATAPRHARVVVRAQPRSQTAWRFASPARPPGLAGRRRRSAPGAAIRRPGRASGSAPGAAPRRPKRGGSAAPAEAIGGFLDTPVVGTIDVGRRGMFLRLGADARYVTGADRTQQALAAWVRTLVGDAYTPLLAEELTAKLGLKIAGLAGLAEDGEAMAGDRGGFGTTTAMVGLEVVRYLRDDRRLPLRLDDGRLRRLEHAVAVERAWITVYDQTKGAAAGGVVRTDVAAFPSTHRHWWVSRSLFIDIAWSLGAKVEALRVAMLAFDAHPSGAGTPSFDAQDQAMGALWDEFNRGADPLNATWRDATLRAHPGMHYLFPEIVDATAAAPAGDAQPKPPSGHAARVRFIEVCLGRYAALAARAVDDQRARRELVDKFAADFKALLDWSTPSAAGDDALQFTIARANAAPFPSSLRVAPPGPLYPSGAEVAAIMGVRADHWLSLWDYRYWWDLLRVEPTDLVAVSASGWTSFKRRLDREVGYTWTDYQRLRKEFASVYGPTGIGAITVAASLGILRMAGTAIKDALRAIFEKPYEKSLVLPGPGLYVLRCSAGDPDRSGALVRVPSAAYQLLYVVEPAELSRRQAEAALERLRTQALDVVDLEALVAADALAGDELAQARDTIEAIRAAVDGRAPALYGLQRKNLERALADDGVLRQASADPETARIELRKRLDEIARILRQRGDNLARATGTPYRVFAVLVTDLGPVLTLMIEAIDVTITSTSATVHVVDATATRSGWEQRTATTRVGAIRAALLSLLENSVTGYGRGYCTILVPTSGRSGLDAHERATFRVDLDTASLMTELIEGSALVVSILALLAAPFTGGASLALLIPLGVIGAIPSAYRLVKRNEEGTFAWDMETALDIVNIASSVLGVSQTGAGALKLTRLAKVVQFAGHGADGLGLVLGTSQFFDELEAIARDESLLPNQRRLAMTMAVANKLVNDGVMVGHALAMRAYGQMVHEGLDPRRYPLGPEVLPASTELPPVRARSIPAELKPASAEVHAQARAGAGRDVLVLVDPALAGMTAEVRYVLDAYGFIAEVYIALGPRAGAAQLPAHAATARQLFKFTGVLGKARTLLDWARAFFARDPSLKVGKTRAWEARVELEKLPKQLADYMRGVHAGLADGSLTPAAIDAYVRGLFDQLAEHEAALRDAATPRGRIAADDRSAPPPSARQQLLAAARAQALAILGLDPAALVVREAPGRGEVRAGVDDDGRIALTVPEHFTDGSPIDAVDLGYALEDHRDRAERRPADVTRPDPAKPWDADREAAYRGRAKAEPGYRWELAPDGTLRYVGHPPRLWSPAHGRFARDPAAPVTPRRPRPTDAPPKYRDEIVPDFYAGTDPDAQIAGWQIDDKRPRQSGGTTHVSTTIKDGLRKATVDNSFTPATAELSLDVHFFHQGIPTKVPTQPAMAAGMSPTAIFFTLRQMRQLGIEPGTLRRLRLHQIQNIETVLQVDSALRALGASLADPVTPALVAKLEATALGLYARTIARQSGHVITGVELGGARARWKLGELMSYYETGLRAQTDPKRARDLHMRLLTDHGLTRDAFVTTDFDLVFLLEDAP